MLGRLMECAKVEECEGEKGLERLRSLRWSFYRQKVDDLNEQLCLTLARLADCFDELLQSGNKAVIPDAQQRAAGNVADSRRLDDQGGRLALRKTTIPVEIRL